ncbi:MAG TPA: tetratricopeptide repeat protein [Aggregatilineales bacterium]|nr:tetratricopeptide repeat protein [Aggregatilineales bacterium]
MKAFLLALLFLSAIFMVAAAPVRAQQPAPQTTPTLSPDQILTEAEAASSAAAQSMNSVNLVLSFIQVGGLALTLLAGLAAIFGLVSTAQYREKMDAEIKALSANLADETRKLAAERDQALAELRESREQLAAQRTQLADQMLQIRDRMNNSNRALALMQLGEQQLEFRNIQGALKLYKQAYDLDSDNPAINYFLGELYLHSDAIEQGRFHLDRATSQGNDYAPIEAAYGFALRLQGEREPDEPRRQWLFAQAEAQFRKALLIDDNVLNLLRESVYAWLGGFYKRQKSYAKAIEAYEHAHRVTPQSSYPVINLGNLYYAEGRVDLARAYYRQSEINATQKLERNPADYWAMLNRIVARLGLDRYDDAVADLHDLLSNQPDLNVPLAKIMGDLERMKHSPQPPPAIDRVIEELQHLHADQA